MTYKQEQAIMKSREKIQEIRNMLDDVMYGDRNLDEKMYNRIREAYDLICSANDRLP